MQDVRCDREWVSRSSQETEDLGERIGRLSRGGDVIGLVGELGSGKTCFVHGVARGLDVRPGAWVRSPTFTLLHQYPGRVCLAHVDLYRLSGDWGDGFDLTELLDDGHVVVIEWFDKIRPEERPKALRVEFFTITEQNRRIRAVAESRRSVEILRGLKIAC
jgi:tRNA threonylcarbamoyladenosine biosynthesis protein TsaE